MPFPTACYHQGGAMLAWDKRERGARGVRPLGKLSLPKSISDRLVCGVCLEQHWGSSFGEVFLQPRQSFAVTEENQTAPDWAGLGWAGEAPRCPRPPPLPGCLFILPGAAGARAGPGCCPGINDPGIKCRFCQPAPEQTLNDLALWRIEVFLVLVLLH